MVLRTISLLALMTVILSQIAFADDSKTLSRDLASKSNFGWPKELHKVSFDEWHLIELKGAPPHFNCEGLTNEEAIKWADAVYIDLRGDGHKQLFINNGGGGSGGRGWSIYDKIHGEWKRIGIGQGSIILCSRYNGYYQLSVRARGGGIYFSKSLLRFERGRYHLVRLENWQYDEEDHPKLIGVQDPKPYDN